MALQNPYLSVIGSQRHDKETILVDLNDRGRAEEAKAVLSEEERFQADPCHSNLPRLSPCHVVKFPYLTGMDSETPLQDRPMKAVQPRVFLAGA